MKPPFVISQIKWLPYPENKPPDKELDYLCLYKDGTVFQHQWSEYMYAKGITEYDWSSEALPDDIVAFAELPTVNLDSEEFDFATALELMKDNCFNRLVCNGKRYCFVNGLFYTWSSETYEKVIAYFGTNEIMGKWKLAGEKK